MKLISFVLCRLLRFHRWDVKGGHCVRCGECDDSRWPHFGCIDKMRHEAARHGLRGDR